MKFTLTDFKGTTNEQFAQAIDALKNNPGSTLFIPEGEYVLKSEEGQKLQKRLMDGEFGFNPHLKLFNYHFEYPEPLLDLCGMKDVTIKGDNVTIICDGFTRILYIHNSENVTVEGITFDYFRRPYTSGKIVKIDEESYDFKADDTRLLNENSPAPRALVYDLEKQCFGDFQNSPVVSSEKLEKISDDTFRIKRKVDKKYLNAPTAIQHTWHTVSAVGIYEAKNVHLAQVTVLCAFGMGIVGQNSENIYLDKCAVKPAENTYFSTNTDSTHFAALSGVLECTDCHFEASGDDGINVHGYYETILSHNGNCAETRFTRYCTHGVIQTYPRCGDVLELLDPTTLKPCDVFKVVKVQVDRKRVTTFLELDHDIPENVTGWYFCNLTQVPAVKLSGCTIKNVIATGACLRTKNSVIENCRIENSSLAAIKVAVEPTWLESGTSENITIKNNEIIDCGNPPFFHFCETSGIWIYLETERQIPLHKNIRIENNKITACENQIAMDISCVDGLCVKNNNADKIKIANCINVDADI